MTMTVRAVAARLSQLDHIFPIIVVEIKLSSAARIRRDATTSTRSTWSSRYGTNMSLPAMPVVMPKNLVLMSLFARAVNKQFNYPNYFSMFPAGPDAVHEISRGFFEIARERRLQTVAIVGALRKD
jgi:hypothetical protein